MERLAQRGTLWEEIMLRRPTRTKDRNRENVKVGERNTSLLSPMGSEDGSTTSDTILVTRSKLGE